jgi:hypothetical protein
MGVSGTASRSASPSDISASSGGEPSGVKTDWNRSSGPTQEKLESRFTHDNHKQSSLQAQIPTMTPYRANQSHIASTSRGPLRLHTKDQTTRTVLVGQNYGFKDRSLQSEVPKQQQIHGTWKKNPQTFLIWLRDNYRKELINYWIDICLLTLRLVTYFLGIPMRFTRSVQQHQGFGAFEARSRPLINMPQAGVSMGQVQWYDQRTPQPLALGQMLRGNNPPPPPGHSVPLQHAIPRTIPLRTPHITEVKHDSRSGRSPSPAFSTVSRRRRIHDMIFEEDVVVEPEDTESEPTF